jgi:hypothetical protein
MSISKSDAIVEITARINEMDLDWPTKPKHVVFDDLTQETDTGWIFFYGIPEDLWVTGRDPANADNPTWQVNRHTGEMTLLTA